MRSIQHSPGCWGGACVTNTPAAIRRSFSQQREAALTADDTRNCSDEVAWCSTYLRDTAVLDRIQSTAAEKVEVLDWECTETNYKKC